MRKLVEADRRLCSAQAQIFAESTRRYTGGSAVFTRRFMRSDLAVRMDEGVFLFEATSTAVLVDALAQGGRPYGSDIYSETEMHWMGYLYRCWCCLTGMSSKAVYGIIGARELRSLYAPYHTLDVVQAVERIMEAKEVQDDFSIPRGVEALARIRGYKR